MTTDALTVVSMGTDDVGVHFVRLEGPVTAVEAVAHAGLYGQLVHVVRASALPPPAKCSFCDAERAVRKALEREIATLRQQLGAFEPTITEELG